MMELIGFEIPTKDDRLALKENKLLSSRNHRTIKRESAGHLREGNEP